MEKDNDKNKQIVKEAEMIVTSYISKIEKKEQQKVKAEQKKQEEFLNKKFKGLKIYAIVSSILLIISVILNFI